MLLQAADRGVNIESGGLGVLVHLFPPLPDVAGYGFVVTPDLLVLLPDLFVAREARGLGSGAIPGIPQGLPREDAILTVDQSGPTTAFVKVKCQIPPRYFTDYLCFLKTDGRWQVAQKVFAVETRK